MIKKWYFKKNFKKRSESLMLHRTSPPPAPPSNDNVAPRFFFCVSEAHAQNSCRAGQAFESPDETAARHCHLGGRGGGGVDSDRLKSLNRYDTRFSSIFSPPIFSIGN